jgi:predicted transcriptional regulator
MEITASKKGNIELGFIISRFISSYYSNENKSNFIKFLRSMLSKEYFITDCNDEITVSIKGKDFFVKLKGLKNN